MTRSRSCYVKSGLFDVRLDYLSVQAEWDREIQVAIRDSGEEVCFSNNKLELIISTAIK